LDGKKFSELCGARNSTPDMTVTSQDSQEETGLPDWADNPANAQNWSTPKKVYNTAAPSLLCLLMLVLSRIASR